MLNNVHKHKRFRFNYIRSGSGQLKKALVRSFLKSIRYSVAKQRGQPMAVFANDLIGLELFLNPYYEYEELNFLLSFCRSVKLNTGKSTVIDIGANIGNHTVFFANSFGKVLAFEANPRTFKLLQLNVSHFDNVDIRNTALGSGKGLIKLHENFINFGGSSSMYRVNSETSYEVEVNTLDNCLKNEFVTDVALIKIDVEGMELPVLQGSNEILREHRPLVAFEQLATDFRNGQSEAVEYLKTLGYQIFWLQDSRSQRGWLMRRFRNLLEIIMPIKEELVLSDEGNIPIRNHSLLIGIHESHL